MIKSKLNNFKEKFMRLLIEIGVEELPAIPFLKELKNIKKKYEDILKEFNLNSSFEFFYTPRRLVFIHKHFESVQPNSVLEFFGAPKAVALKDGEFTQAALAFAKKCAIEPSQLEFISKDGKEILYYKKEVQGKKSEELLETIISKFLNSLNFGKSMRWSDKPYEFIRPIRSILVLCDDKLVDMEIFGIRSSKSFLPNRYFSYDAIEIENQEDYFIKLAQNGVMLDPVSREHKILDEFKILEEKNGVKIEIDPELLAEVVAITEFPSAIMGSFDEEFLQVPKEVIILSMKTNQRYFPVFKDEKLSNHFITVTNSLTNDFSKIVKGNEKVLRARLSDAMFFYENDLKSEFSCEKLKNVMFLSELGSVYDKVLREQKIALELAQIYKNELIKEAGSEYFELIKRASELTKADLGSSMVGEFPELQGVIGYYYALKKGENQIVANAIKEQYLPTGENSAMPSTLFSTIIAISNKLDSLIALFSIKKIPSGNKDPYALRRAAIGLIKCVLDQDISFDIRKMVELLSLNYKEFNQEELISFILDRLFTQYNINSSIISAVLKSNITDLKELNSSILALNEISCSCDFRDRFDTFKRLANILKDSEVKEINKDLFILDEEKELYKAYKNIEFKESKVNYLDRLFGLKPLIDNFFDRVMINDKDEKIKDNRIALIGSIYQAILKVADIKEISL